MIRVLVPRIERKSSLAIALLLSVCVSLVCASGALGQVFYSFPSGDVLDDGETAIGPYVAGGDLFRLGGFARTHISTYLDAGIEVLADLDDSDWFGGMGVDAKFRLFPETNKIPFDLSGNAGFGFIRNKDASLLQFPVGAIISSPYELDSGNILTPYLGVYLLIVNTEVERADGSKSTNTDVDAELRGGLRYQLSSGLDIYGALHIGRDALALVGFIFTL